MKTLEKKISKLREQTEKDRLEIKYLEAYQRKVETGNYQREIC